MAFDSIDKIFNDMLKRYSKLFGHDAFDVFPAFPNFNPDEEGIEFEDEKEKDARVEKQGSRAVSRKFGYEIISGSNMKEPIIRIYGNPDDFPELKGQLEGLLKQGFGPIFNGEGLQLPQGDIAGIEHEPAKVGDGKSKEPFSESFKDKEGNTIVNVDLPGVKEPDVSVKLDGKSIRVEAHSENKHYQKTIQLEKNASADALEWHLNNGVLEIKIPAGGR